MMATDPTPPEQIELAARFAVICTNWLRRRVAAVGPADVARQVTATFRWIDRHPPGTPTRTNALRDIALLVTGDDAAIARLAVTADEVAFDGGRSCDFAISDVARLAALPGAPGAVRLVADGLGPWEAILTADLLGFDAGN